VLETVNFYGATTGEFSLNGKKVMDSLPAGYTDIEAFLKGYYLKYENEDHHVKQVKTKVRAWVAYDGTGWCSARGILADNNADDEYFYSVDVVVMIY
jgi:hypothetical protein